MSVGNGNSKKLKIVLVPKSKENNSIQEIIDVPHPRTGKMVKFLTVKLSEGKRELFELNQYKDPSSSWFIEDMVKSDGTFYVGNKFDPLFSLLYYFSLHADEKFRVLDQMIENVNPDVITESFVNDKQIEKISDVLERGGIVAYK